jgi:alpha-D-ribose 1-methylphosphonate 5-triphosphate synthase subunit PhnH
MTLFDNEVSFHVSGGRPLAEEIHALTLAEEACAASADFVFVCDPAQLEQAIESAKCGTLSDPHKGATLLVENEGVPVCRLRLRGPGIDGEKEIWATERVRDAITLRDAQQYEYPQGIDLLFLSKAGELVAIPRLTRMEVIPWRM